jgi:predicted dehydrogenase
MAQAVRIAVVGTGHIAQVMVAAMAHVPGLDPVAIVSRDAARAAAVAAQLGIARHHDGLAAVLADPAVDAVYIANDTAAHADAAIAALAAGKAVLCEKPLAVNAAQAEAIAAAARRSGRLFMEAVATPFVPAVKAALERAAAGGIGQVRALAADFGYPATPETHAGCWKPEGGGVLLDRAIYPVTLARLALGPVERVQAAVTRDASGIDVEAALMLEHRGGAVSQVAASLTALMGNALTLSGTAGAITVAAPLLSAERLEVRHAGPAARGIPGGMRRRLAESGLLRRARATAAALRTSHIGYGASPYVHELAHFRDLIRAGAGESPVLPPSLSVEVMRVLDAAREAGR